MSIPTSGRALAALALIAAASVALAPPVTAQEQGCPTPAAKKKKGLGGLLSSARGSGLLGSVMGAARGDGSLKSSLVSVAEGVAVRTIEAAACAEPNASADNEGSTATDQPRAERRSSPARAAAAPSYSYPSELPKPADFATVKAAFDEFGKDRCQGCEGGFAYDSWPAFPRDAFSGKYNGDDQRIGSWPVGHVHRWSGNVSTGTLTVVAEEMVAGFKCRRLLYRLQKPNAAAERPGLLCWGRANQFAGKESWNRVY